MPDFNDSKHKSDTLSHTAKIPVKAFSHAQEMLKDGKIKTSGEYVQYLYDQVKSKSQDKGIKLNTSYASNSANEELRALLNEKADLKEKIGKLEAENAFLKQQKTQLGSLTETNQTSDVKVLQFMHDHYKKDCERFEKDCEHYKKKCEDLREEIRKVRNEADDRVRKIENKRTVVDDIKGFVEPAISALMGGGMTPDPSSSLGSVPSELSEEDSFLLNIVNEHFQEDKGQLASLLGRMMQDEEFKKNIFDLINQ